MNRLFKLLGMVLMSLAAASPGVAQDKHPTADEAVALVKRAVAYIKENGKEKAFNEFNNINGKFVDRSLYIFVYDMTGTNLAIGNSSSARIIGKNLYDLKDPDGVYTIRRLIDIGNSTGKGWLEHKFVNPVTKNVEPKSTYVEKYQDVIVGSGVFK